MFKNKLFIVRLMLFKQLLVEKVLKYLPAGRVVVGHALNPSTTAELCDFKVSLVYRVPGLTPQLLRNPVS